MLRFFSLSRNNHRRVAASYILAFVVVSVCVVTMFLSIRWLLKEQKRNSEFSNVASRQSMLSQRLALASTNLASAESSDERYAARKILLQSRSQFQDSHRFLLNGNRENRDNGKLSSGLRQIFFDGEACLNVTSLKFVDNIDLLTSFDADDPELAKVVFQIKEVAEGSLLADLEDVVKVADADVYQKTLTMLRWVSVLFLITLIVLVIQAVYIFQPILNANERIDRAANHDPLTELPNRRRLAERADMALLESQKNNLSIGFMHIDLDRFKAVNDTMGHGAGDQVLKSVAKTLEENLRPEQLIARIGGDEFAVLFTNVRHVEELIGPAKRLIEKLEYPIDVDDKKCTIGCSIGLAISSAQELDYERVLMDADIALYEAKKNGRNQFQIITESLRGQFERKERVTKEIREGIADSEFVPFFQPQFNSKTGDIIGVEALARWIKKDGVFEKNAEFIQIADEIGLLSEIDQQILRKSLAAFLRWRKAGYNVPRISLNVSMKELESPDYVKSLTATVAEFGLSPVDVSIEILESVFLDDDNTVAVSNINMLSDIGFTVELDDFGTGHAAIISLLDLAVDRIKLDRSLIRDVEDDGPGQTITRTLIQLAHELDIDTLAEGIETETQAERLREMGCVNHQGYHYARPMSEKELTVWIEESIDSEKSSATPG